MVRRGWRELEKALRFPFPVLIRVPPLAWVLPSEFIWGLPLNGVNVGFESVKLVKATFIRMLAIRNLGGGEQRSPLFLS